MGEVTYVGSSYISVTAYTGGEDVTDFTLSLIHIFKELGL